MGKKRILFISGSLGLGHISRDLAIKKELFKVRQDCDVVWLAAEPARSVLEQEGERLVEEIDLYRNDNVFAESASKESQLNLLKYATSAIGGWYHNARVIEKIVKNGQFDLVIGDETYELTVALVFKLIKLPIPFIILYDFLGLDAMSRNPVEKIGVFIWNRIWSLDRKIFKHRGNAALFVGESEDIPDKKFSFLLPNRRAYARKYYNFIGYILTFDPNKFTDDNRLRHQLGYSENPLVMCSIGGTAIGRNLLELCGHAFNLAKQKIPNLHMILVCGPRLPAESLDVPQDPNLEIVQYVPDLYKHLAACDLAIVQGGGTTTLELTALQRPFLYFPIEGHSEQECVVAERLNRYEAGVRMSYSQTTAESLSDAIRTYMGRPVNYKDVPVYGASKAVQLINTFI